MPNTKEILIRLKALREEKELRQEQIATCLGIDRTTYVRKESGAIPITTEEWLKLGETMEMDPSYFFGISGPNEYKDGDMKERLLLNLYKLLSPDDRDCMIAALRLLLKNVQSKGVQDALKQLYDG